MPGPTEGRKLTCVLCASDHYAAVPDLSGQRGLPQADVIGRGIPARTPEVEYDEVQTHRAGRGERSALIPRGAMQTQLQRSGRTIQGLQVSLEVSGQSLSISHGLDRMISNIGG